MASRTVDKKIMNLFVLFVFLFNQVCVHSFQGFHHSRRRLFTPNCERKVLLQLSPSNSTETLSKDNDLPPGTNNVAAPPRFKKHAHRTKSKKFNKQKRKEMATQKRNEKLKSSSSTKIRSRGTSRKHSTGKYNKYLNEEMDLENEIELESSSMESDAKSYAWLDNHPALLLNADYQPMSHLPLSLWTWQDAVKSVFSGKVTVVDVYPDVYIRAANIKMPLPSVIALSEYAPHARGQKPAFTRKNVFLRDKYKCQYCNNQFRTYELTLDHVKPRCMGGRLNWENAVTCCSKCNGKKGSLQVHELKSVGMKLVREPRVPSSLELAQLAEQILPKKVHPTWIPYLPYVTQSHSARVTKGSSDITAVMNELEE